MRRILQAGLLVISCLAWPHAASAQVRCPEGKAFNGDCVNPALAEAIRKTAIIFAQPKLSQTAYPVLPADDRLYRYPNQLIPDPLRPSPFAGPPVP